MERSYGDEKPTFNSIDPLPGRLSIDTPASARLQKKRSVKPVRRAPSQARAASDFRQSNPQNRKSSLKDAVRNIFSRRSKIQEPVSVQTTPSHHKPHGSQLPETTTLQALDRPPERAVSAPLRPHTASVDLPRIRSPNAVEFPKSRHLKPLVLPTPFDDPRSTLRRRKTLPSILVSPQEAQVIAAAITSGAPHDTNIEQVPQFDSGPAVTSKKAKRRSRSAGNSSEQALQPGPQRKRSDEIRFWRESIQTAILRTSGFSDPDTAELKTPPPNSTFDLQSPSIFGTEYSRDLEDRVARLESNLQSFQRSLRGLQSNKSRRTGFHEASPRLPLHDRSDSADYRTPSMLAEDLQLPIPPSEYRYAFEPLEKPSGRTSTMPSRPARPPRPSETIPPVPAIRQPVAEPNVKQQLQPTTPTAVPVDATYQSLYQMLDDERSSRLQLELQLRDMRSEISDLRLQVSAQSHVQSQRSSYLFPTGSDMTAGSSRLRELLAEAEGDPRRSMSPLVVTPSKVISRFSASTRQESEAGATQASSDELQEREGAPRMRQLDNMEEESVDYKTPTQVAKFPLPPTYTREGQMF